MNIWLLFLHVLFQFPIFPGPGIGVGAPDPVFDAKGASVPCGTPCPGTPPQTTVTFNPAAGKYAIVFVSWCANGACNPDTVAGDVTSVSDGGTNTFSGPDATCISRTGGVGAQKESTSAYHVTSTAGGSTTLTVQWASGSGFYGTVTWSSYANLNGFDTSGCGNVTSGTTISANTSGNLSTSNGIIAESCNGQASMTKGASFTLLSNPVTGYVDAYKVGGTAGSTGAADCSQGSSGGANMIVSAYKHL